MEEISDKLVGGAWETMGVSGALFILLIILVGGGGFALYRLAMNWMDLHKDKPKSVVEAIDERNVPGKGTMMGIARDEVDRARQTAREKLDALEGKVNGNKTSTDKDIADFKSSLEKKFDEFKSSMEKKFTEQSQGHTNQEGRIANLEGWRTGMKGTKDD